LSALVVGVGIILAAILWLVVSRAPSDDHEHQQVTQAALVGGPFSLVDHTGRAVTDDDFQGTHTLVFFGFASCTDVCPTTLSEMTGALELLDELESRVQPLFITIDPARDTPAALADYVEHFHPRLLGLTGSPAQIRQVAEAYRVYYAKAPLEGADYQMDHTAVVYLMGPEGQYLTHFTTHARAQDMAENIRHYLAGS
jgi:cytochrome oxidase Cu insertion factor (SCO1/SenC/PrrC family)